jgi:hypothetical protein
VLSIGLGRPGSISENITLENDQHAYQEHENCDPIDNMHGLDVDIFRTIGILLPEKITSYFS